MWAPRDGIFRADVGAATTFAGTFPADLFETWLQFERTASVWRFPTWVKNAERRKIEGEVSF